MQQNTARDFALQLGALGSLYLSLALLLVLLFGIINLQFPDATDTVWTIDQAQSSIRIGISFVLVFFPAYLVLTRLVNKHRRAESGGSYLGVTRWLIYLSLVVGGGVLLGDLVAVIMFFLDGEITTRFILKAASVLIVIGVACYYYLLDARGHWMANEKKSIQIGIIAVVVAASAIVSGFLSIDSPAEVREKKIDQQQVMDLQDMQWRIVEYVRTNDELPTALTEVYVNDVPMAPEDRMAYAYNVTATGFDLCATFAYASERNQNSFARPVLAPLEKDLLFAGTENWDYQAGRFCFERTVDLPEDADIE